LLAEDTAKRAVGQLIDGTTVLKPLSSSVRIRKAARGIPAVQSSFGSSADLSKTADGSHSDTARGGKRSAEAIASKRLSTTQPLSSQLPGRHIDERIALRHTAASTGVGGHAGAKAAQLRRKAQQHSARSQNFRNQSGRASNFLLQTMANTAAGSAANQGHTSTSGHAVTVSLPVHTGPGSSREQELDVHPLVQAHHRAFDKGRVAAGHIASAALDDGLSDDDATDLAVVPPSEQQHAVTTTLGDRRVTQALPGRAGVYNTLGLTQHGRASRVPAVPQLDLAQAKAVLRAEEAAEGRRQAALQGEALPNAHIDGRLGSTWGMEGGPDHPVGKRGGAQTKGGFAQAPLVTRRTASGQAAAQPNPGMDSFAVALKAYHAAEAGMLGPRDAVNARNTARPLPPAAGTTTRRLRGGVATGSARQRRLQSGGVTRGVSTGDSVHFAAAAADSERDAASAVHDLEDRLQSVDFDKLLGAFRDLDTGGQGLLTAAQLAAGLRRVNPSVSMSHAQVLDIAQHLGVQASAKHVPYADVLSALAPSAAGESAALARGRAKRRRFMNTGAETEDMSQRPPRAGGAGDLRGDNVGVDTHAEGGPCLGMPGSTAPGMTDADLAAASLDAMLAQKTTNEEHAEAIAARQDVRRNIAAVKTAQGLSTFLREKAAAFGHTPGLFNWLDADCDGVLSVPELGKSLAKLHINAPEQELELFVRDWAGKGAGYAGGPAVPMDAVGPALTYADFAKAVETRDPMHERITALRPPPKGAPRVSTSRPPRGGPGSTPLHKHVGAQALWDGVLGEHPLLTQVLPLSHRQARQLHLDLDRDVDNTISTRDLALHVRRALSDTLTLKITDRAGAQVRAEMEQRAQVLEQLKDGQELPAPETVLDHAIAGVIALADQDGDGWLSQRDMLTWAETLSNLNSAARPISAGSVSATAAFERLDALHAAAARNAQSQAGGMDGDGGPAPSLAVSRGDVVLTAAQVLLSGAVDRVAKAYQGAHLTKNNQPVHPALSAALMLSGARDDVRDAADRQLTTARDAVKAKQSTITAKAGRSDKTTARRQRADEAVQTALLTDTQQLQAGGGSNAEHQARKAARGQVGAYGVGSDDDSSDDDAAAMPPAAALVAGATTTRGLTVQRLDTAGAGSGTTATISRQSAAWSAPFNAGSQQAFDEVQRIHSARATGVGMPAAGASGAALARTQEQATNGLSVTAQRTQDRSSAPGVAAAVPRDGSLFKTTDDLLTAPVPVQELQKPTRYGARVAAMARSTSHVVQPPPGAAAYADDSSRLQSVARSVMAQGLSPRATRHVAGREAGDLMCGLAGGRATSAATARVLHPGSSTAPRGGLHSLSLPLGGSARLWGPAHGPSPVASSGTAAAPPDTLSFTGRGVSKSISARGGGNREAAERDIVQRMEQELIEASKKQAARVQLKKSLRSNWESKAWTRHSRTVGNGKVQYGNASNRSTVGLINPVMYDS